MKRSKAPATLNQQQKGFASNLLEMPRNKSREKNLSPVKGQKLPSAVTSHCTSTVRQNAQMSKPVKSVIKDLVPASLGDYGRFSRIKKSVKETVVKKKAVVAPRLNNRKVLPAIRSFLEIIDDMLAGVTTGLLPKPPSEVRIFLSSTFSDMRQERNSLVKHVYPKIKAFCYNELDLDFQIVDMRWGVTDDATNEHITEKLCLEQILHCQNLSLGPNFVTILGDRYGSRMCPTELDVREFEMLLEECSDKDKELLNQWYLKDENAIPPQYILQPIKSHLKYFGDYSPENEANKKRDTALWWQIHDKLQKALWQATDAALKKGIITDARKHDFVKSVTECEIELGILQASDPTSHTLCFIRHFEDLGNERLSDNGAQRHVDTCTVDGQKRLNKEIEELRNSLQQKKITAKLPVTHISRYELPWQPDGVNTSHIAHAEYLKSFMSEFEKRVIGLIKNAKDQQNNTVLDSEYYTKLDEILHHLHFCQEKCATFRGQEGTIELIHKYLHSKHNNRPLVIHADSGRGKTSLMAMTFNLLPSWFNGTCFRVIRFLGTSPDSTCIYDVLFSVMGQLADIMDQILEPHGYSSMNSLIKYFPRFLRNVARASKHPIFIFLDSIDQLDVTDSAYALNWLPTQLPANIKLIVSTLPNTHNILDRAKKILSDSGTSGSDDCFIELPPLAENTGKEIIDAYLGSKHRSLTPAQRELVLKSLAKVPSPLYLKLLLDRGVRWRSYDPVGQIGVADSVRCAINQMFVGLEQKYGEVLISHTLGYMTLGMNGLSEVEIEDVLSCNDAVLNEVYQYHDPPVQGVVRIPGLLWARIRHDLSEYVVERLSSGKKTIFWYHRQFIEAAQERYTEEDRHRSLHKDLADLYQATDGVQRDIQLVKRKLNIANADRLVTTQPLSPKNKRKLLALPHHLKGAGDVIQLKQSVLCNLDFMMTKIRGLSFQALLRDFKGDGDVQDEELFIVHSCLEELNHLKNPAHLPMELLTKLQEDYRYPYIQMLIQKARDRVMSLGKEALLPLYPCLLKQKCPVLSELQAECVWSVGKNYILAQRTTSENLIEVLLLHLPSKQLYNRVFTIDLRAVTVDEDKNLLYTVSSDKTQMNTECKVWQLDDIHFCKSAHIFTLELAVPVVFTAVHKSILALAMCDNNVVLLNCDNNTVPAQNMWGLNRDEGRILALRFLSDGTLMAVLHTGAETSKAYVYKQGTKINSHNKLESCVHFIQDLPVEVAIEKTKTEALLCIAGTDRHMSIVYVEKDKPVMVKLATEAGPVSCFTVAKYKNNGNTLFVATESDIIGYSLLVQGKIVYRQALTEGQVLCMAMADDAGCIYTGTDQGEIKVWLDPPVTVKAHSGATPKLLSHESGVLVSIGVSGKMVMISTDGLKEKSAKTESLLRTPSSDPKVESLENYFSVTHTLFNDDEVITLDDNKMTFWLLSDRTRIHEVLVGRLTSVVAINHGLGHIEQVVGINSEANHVVFVSINAKKVLAKVAVPHRALCLTTNGLQDTVYVACKSEDQLSVQSISQSHHNILYTIKIQQTFSPIIDDIAISLTQSEHYLVMKIRVTDKEYEIISKAEAKQNFKESRGKYKFAAIDLRSRSGALIPCNRILTKIPCLCNTWLMYMDNTVIIGFNRIICVWDIESGKCDQKMLKGTKIPKFFRPFWIESDVDWDTICHGLTLCMSTDQHKKVMAVGSEDGFVMVYDYQSGKNLGGNLKSKKPQHSNKGNCDKLRSLGSRKSRS